ncbi:MAG: VTT domain-containing protein [Dehalococcoidia bacterium]|nr:VTT domain-containing protein [Dehalococcoidia bacterium]
MQIDFARLRKNRWLRLAIVFAVIVALSLALMYLFNWLLAPVKDDLKQYELLAYLVVFGVALAANMTIIAPVYVFTPIMVAAADIYNPALIALAAALGGSVGEMSGYFAGAVGKKIVFNEYPEAYERVTLWVDKYGLLAIAVLAFQPVFPFDVAGIVAGATKMPPHRFFAACFLGKFPKYLITCYMFDALKQYLPFM